MVNHPEKRLLGYEDFELKIEHVGGRYRAQVLHSPGGEASGYFDLPLTRDRIELLILQMGQPRRRRRPISRSIHTPEMQAARELGGELFETVLSDEIRACFRTSLERVYGKRNTGLRIKLRLEEVPELAELPWELLRDGAIDRFLSLSAETPIVRYLELPQKIPPLPVELPLQVLVMVSSPSDYQLLDVERERRLLDKALEPLEATNKVQITYLEGATLRELRRTMRKKQYHIFHFIGHGGFDLRTEAGMLVLEDDSGKGQPVHGDRLAAVLQNRRSLRLAILNACEGARNSRQDPYSSVATRLIQQGVPAVIAMQFEITDEAALTFADELYTALAEGWPVDAALAEARSAIYTLPSDIEWGTPVLYLRAADGVLFDVGALESSDPTITDPTLTSATLTSATISDMAFDVDAVLAEECSQDLDEAIQSIPPGGTATAETPSQEDRPGAVTAELPPLGSAENPVLHLHTHYHSDPQTTPEEGEAGFPEMFIPTRVKYDEQSSPVQSKPVGRFPTTLMYPDRIPQDKPKPRAEGTDEHPAVQEPACRPGNAPSADDPAPADAEIRSLPQSGPDRTGFVRRVPRTQLAPDEPPTLPRRPGSQRLLPVTPRTEDAPWIPTARPGMASPLDVEFSPLGTVHPAGPEPAGMQYNPDHYPAPQSSSSARWLISLLVAVAIIAGITALMMFG